MKLTWEAVLLKDEGFWVSLFDRKTGVVEDSHTFLMPYCASDVDICPVKIVMAFQQLSGFEEGRIFRQLWKGKFTENVKGIHKLRLIPRFIATSLGIEDPLKYTGQCFRRTSATALADSGASRTSLKRHGAWKSDSVVEGYLHNSKKIRTEIARQLDEDPPSIVNSRNASVTPFETTSSLKENVAPFVLNLSNCSNVTFNFGSNPGFSLGQNAQVQSNVLGLSEPVVPLALRNSSQ
jgi:hypothetical protein